MHWLYPFLNECLNALISDVILHLIVFYFEILVIYIFFNFKAKSVSLISEQQMIHFISVLFFFLLLYLNEMHSELGSSFFSHKISPQISEFYINRHDTR